MSRLFLKDNGDWHIYDLINFNTSIFTQIYIKMFILDTPDLPLSVKKKKTQLQNIEITLLSKSKVDIFLFELP